MVERKRLDFFCRGASCFLQRNRKVSPETNENLFSLKKATAPSCCLFCQEGAEVKRNVDCFI